MRLNVFPALLLVSILTVLRCMPPATVDLIVTDARVYTVDSAFTIAEAFAVKDGNILAVGSAEEVNAQYRSDSVLRLGGKPVYPGFMDAHCHFYSLGKQRSEADLTDVTSWEEVLNRLQTHYGDDVPTDQWITGRGWDHTRWPNRKLPRKAALDTLYPDHPVLLTRVDGHAAIANSRALEIADITTKTKVAGGRIERADDRLTGILIDKAIELVTRHIPSPDRAAQRRFLLEAQQQCLAQGLTMVSDAGLSRAVIERIDSLHQSGDLQIRVYAMLTPSEADLTYYLNRGPYRTERLHVCAVKFYADGALGSRGAYLLEAYADEPGYRGLLLEDTTYFQTMARRVYAAGFQMNTHAIGDGANRLMLETYAGVLPEDNDRRWRIEHAQVVHPADMSLFGKYRIIPSVQPTHATSDMRWAEDRLGPGRLNGAYAYKSLLHHAGLLAGGSDFPVEPVNPLYGFHAAVSRQDRNGQPEGGFRPEEALTREAALRSMTEWVAYANFEEDRTGTIEPGKKADFVVLDRDIMEIPIHQVPDVRVLHTYVAGEEVFRQ